MRPSWLLSCVLLLGCGGGSTAVSLDGGAIEGGAGGPGSDGSGGGTDGGGTDSGGPRCTPGAAVFCRCSNRDEGTKTCAADGQSFEPCTTANGPCPP